MNVIDEWVAEELVRTPPGPSADELRHRARVRRTRRLGVALTGVAVVTVFAGIVVSRPPGERRVQVGEPTPATSTSLPSITSTTSPQPEPKVATPWRPLDESGGRTWTAALAAVRSAETVDAAVADVERILRAGREQPSEMITTLVAEQRGGDYVIQINWLGFGDDSVAATDARIRVSTGGPTLVVRTAEIRSICRRGVSGEFCL